MSTTKQVLRSNVLALLTKDTPLQGKETGVTRLKAKGLSNGNAQRVLDESSTIGTDRMDELAEALHVEPWQLLVPHLDPKKPPKLSTEVSSWPFHLVDEQRYRDLHPDDQAFVQSKLESAIEERELRRRRVSPTPAITRSLVDDLGPEEGNNAERHTHPGTPERRHRRSA